MHGVVALAGFALGALFCAVLAVAEWGAWTLVAPGRRLRVGDTGGSLAEGQPSPPQNGAAANGQAGAPANVVGRVAGTEDSTPLQFAVAIDESAYLQLDDVVVTVSDGPWASRAASGRSSRGCHAARSARSRN